MAKLKSDIDQLSEQLVVIKEKIVELNHQKIENSLFYNDYLTFIRYYQQASEVTSSDIKKYLYWDKNYQSIKSKLAIHTGYDNFDEYKTKLLSNIKSISIEDHKKSLLTISKTKFKELSWWQKIINKISWTWTKTKNAIAKIKTKNTTNFENLIKKININDSLISEINITLQEKNNWLILPISEPWDQWIIEKEFKYLSRQDSNDSGFSFKSEENNCANIAICEIDKILSQINIETDQEFNQRISRTSSTDSGVCFEQSTSKLVSTNPFDNESDDEQFTSNTSKWM